MTFLEMVQRLRLETNYANTGPSSVSGQSGDHERAVAWVVSAWTDIQNRHTWRWMRKQFTLTVSSGTSTYDYTSAIDSATSTAISRFKSWHLKDSWNPPKCYLQSSGSGTEYWLTYVPWEHFRTIYQIGTQTPGAPAHITIDPSDQLVIGPEPNDTYVISGEHNRSAQVLSVNADEPEMQSDYHMVIVYEAMKKYGLFRPAPEVFERARIEGRPILRRMEATQMFMPRQAGPMA
jgi:hypothetical protein